MEWSFKIKKSGNFCVLKKFEELCFSPFLIMKILPQHAINDHHFHAEKVIDYMKGVAKAVLSSYVNKVSGQSNFIPSIQTTMEYFKILFKCIGIKKRYCKTKFSLIYVL